MGILHVRVINNALTKNLLKIVDYSFIFWSYFERGYENYLNVWKLYESTFYVWVI